ncbi:MAG: 50S ribosomal protein L15 [Endomicrobiia bacterium]
MQIVNLSNLRPAEGSKHRKKILGHGRGSGHGGSSTRGMKGQRSRSGDPKPSWFEGGQMPLLRRIPKRGFTNTPFKIEYNYVNLETLDKKFSSGEKVTPDILFEKGIIKKKNLPVKILADGEITKPLNVIAHKFSKKAEEKIKKSGGTVEKLQIEKQPVKKDESKEGK